jgi:phosphoserine phosphatase
MKALKYYGYKTAILSGGFTFFGNYLKKLGLIMFTNELEMVY